MKRIIPILMIIIATAGGYWWFTRSTVDAAAPAGLTGSGAIEAETIAITAEIGGRIIALKVDEGDEVKAGQVLVEIDQANLLAQQAQLEAALATAQANLTAVSAPPRQEEIATAAARLSQAQVARDGAQITWQTAQVLASNPHELQTRLNQAQAQVTQLQKNLELAQVGLKKAEIQAEGASRNQSNHAALVQNDVAQQQLKAAQVGLKMAETALAGGNQQVELLRQLRDHPLQLISQVNAAKAAYQQAEAVVLVAQANLTAAKANPTPEDIAVAQAQLAEAGAALETVKVQLNKLTLTAPRAGLVSKKLVQAGELAAPGTSLLELSDIDTVDLTVYLPETQIGQVKVGQQARVYVDTYPGETFTGAITFITPQAEFTPRNVQTQEERVNLVFGVKITLDNPDHRLKPGMPADAEIIAGSEPAAQKSPPSSPTRLVEPTTSPTPAVTATPVVAVAPLAPTPTPSPWPVTLPTVTTAAPKKQVEVLSWGLNVRHKPGAQYPVIAHLAKGAKVELLETDPQTGWLRVQLPAEGQTGWITNNPTYVSIQ